MTPVSEAKVRIYGTEGEAVVDYNVPHGLCYRLAGEESWNLMFFDQPDRFTLQAGHFLECITFGVQPLAGRAVMALAVMRGLTRLQGDCMS
ncbi:MAG: hypothetical protein R2911_03010 [Caldilineaceae bacterium]